MEPKSKMVEFTAPNELKQRFKFLPKDVWPENGQFFLSQDINVIQKEIARSRKDESAWPKIHYLWELNPVVQWVNDQVLASFGRHEAPVITLAQGLDVGEMVFLMSGLIPNRKGQPLVHRWFGVVYKGGTFYEIEELESLLKRTGLGSKAIPNSMGYLDDYFLNQKLPEAVGKAQEWMKERRRNFVNELTPKLQQQSSALEKLKGKQMIQLELNFDDLPKSGTKAQDKKEAEKRRINKLFNEYLVWVEDTMTTEEKAYIQVAAVFLAQEG
jgi:hypothetical protein